MPRPCHSFSKTQVAPLVHPTDKHTALMAEVNRSPKKDSERTVQGNISSPYGKRYHDEKKLSGKNKYWDHIAAQTRGRKPQEKGAVGDFLDLAQSRGGKAHYHSQIYNHCNVEYPLIRLSECCGRHTYNCNEQLNAK